MATEAFTNVPTTTVPGGADGTAASGQAQTWTVTSSSGWPAAGTVAGVATQFHVSDPAQPTEMIAVTYVTGTAWNVIRGSESSPVSAHAAGFTIYQVTTAGYLNSVVVNSGTAVTPYLILAGGTAGTTQMQQVASIGGSGQVLTSQGTGKLPAWVAGAGFANPMTTFGDTLYEGGTAAARLAGPAVSAKRFLTSTGSGGTANAPAWGTIASADVGGVFPVTSGGLGAGTLTAFAVLAGGTSSTSPVQQVSGAGTSGQVLTSNGAGSLPSWQAGGTGGSVTFPVTVDEGGTGGTSATAYAVVIGGTAATSALQQVPGTGTSGQILASQGTGQPPQWIANTGGSITIPVPVTQGGTGGTAVTAYAVVTGGTTATDAFQPVTAGAGSVGFVLTSNGVNTLPSWQHPTGGTSLSNPMTAVGDMIVGGAGSPAVATRLANSGTAGLILTSNGTNAEPAWQYPRLDWLNVMQYQATGNAVNSLATSGVNIGQGDGAVTSGSHVFTSASLAPFTGSRQIWVPGAGAGGSTLVTTVTCTVAGTSTLTAAASTTVTGKVATWGTDDTNAIKAALAVAAQSVNPANPLGLTVYFPAGIYLVSSPLVVPPGVVLLGSGRSFAYYGGSQPFQMSTPILKPTSGFSTSTSVGGQTVTGVIVFVSQALGGYPGQSGNQMVRNITIDGRLVTPGVTNRGIEAWGPVWGVKLEDVGIFGMASYGVFTNKSTPDGTGKFPNFWQVFQIHVAACHNDGLNITSMSDSYFIGSESTGNSGNGWTFNSGGDNNKIATCKAEYNTGVGLYITKGSGSRPWLINGFATDGNYQHGMQFDGTGPGPVVITGAGLNQDGWNNGAGGNFGGLSITGGMTVTCTGLFVTTSVVNPPGGPQYGVYLPSSFTGVLQLDNCDLYGNTAGIFVDPAATGSLQIGANVLTGTGNWTGTPTGVRYQPLEATGGLIASAPALGAWQPDDHNLAAWSYDPTFMTTGFAAVSGTQYLIGLKVNQSTTVSNIYWAVQTAATTAVASQNFVGLVDSTNGHLLASAGVDANVTAVFGLKTTAITATAVTPGLYWVVMMFNFTGTLKISGMSSFTNTVPNVGLATPATYRFATCGAGKTSLSNFPITPSSNVLAANTFFAAIG